MEKRDILIIIVAIFIVLIMAMYVKPLVTGQPVKLLPDELAAFFGGGNQTAVNNTSSSNVTPNTTSVPPSVASVNPDSISSNEVNSAVVIEGANLTESMNITFFKDGIDKTFRTEFQNGTLIATNVSLPEGNWAVTIQDSSGSGAFYNTTKFLNVLPEITPVPTWDGKPIPLKVTPKPTYQSYPRPYPEDPIINKTPMDTYSDFGGVSSVSTAPINIPYGYWDIQYTVDYQTHIANPKDTTNNVFEFNKQFKEPLVTYQGNPVVFYPKDSAIPDMIPSKVENISDKKFNPSKDKILIKIPVDKPNRTENEMPFTVSVISNTGQALVETVGYTKPDISIRIKNVDYPDSPDILIRPEGGIDPLQWDEKRHKVEAEKILKQEGKLDLLSSPQYKKEWDDTWARTKDPRPWTQRIYGKGNYSFIIDTQSIDSYNIQIKVPNSTAKNLTFTRPGTSNLISTGDQMENTFKSYIEGINGDISDSPAFEKIIDSLSQNVLSQHSRDDIFREVNRMKNAGIIINGFARTDAFFQGPEGSLKGNLAYSTGTSKRVIPIDLPYVQESDGWKIDDLPIIRT